MKIWIKIKQAVERTVNAFRYKVLLRFPYSKVRAHALRSLGYSIGKDSYFPSDIIITQYFIDNKCHLSIGDRVSIGPNVILALTQHANYSNINQYINKKPFSITIEDDAWIGAGAIILPGVTIGTGAIVGAGSVVTHSVESYTVVAGNPARVIKKVKE